MGSDGSGDDLHVRWVVPYAAVGSDDYHSTDHSDQKAAEVIQ